MKPNIFLNVFFTVILGLFLVLPAHAFEIPDTDGDGLNDVLEAQIGTYAVNPDSDGDGFKDGEEVASGYNPLKGKGDRQVKRRVEVNLSQQKMDYFFNDVKIGSFPISTGRLNAPTPVGEFKILKKVPVKTYPTITGGSYPNTKWNLMFKPSYYIHSAYWHNDFGIRPRSGGCINLRLSDAQLMYKYLDVGDLVKVYGKTPTKPLAKIVSR